MRLLIVDPSKRLTAKQALNNQWIQGKTAKIDHLESAIDNLRVIVNKKRAKVRFGAFYSNLERESEFLEDSFSLL